MIIRSSILFLLFRGALPTKKKKKVKKKKTSNMKRIQSYMPTSVSRLREKLFVMIFFLMASILSIDRYNYSNKVLMVKLLR